MATPNADRLRGIGQWDPSANDATSDVLGAIKTELDSVADLTESVATNLGSAIKGSTAEAVTASLDALGKKVRRHSEDIGVIVEARKEALDAGREAQNKNIEIQQELAEAQARYDSVVRKEPYLQAEMRALRTLDADHAKAENQAITALSTLRERTAAAIQRIPALGGEETGSSNGDEPGRRRSGDRQSSGGSDSRRRSGNGGTGGDGSGSGQNGSGAGGPGSGGSGDAGASGGSASGPIRSATRWSATIPDPSAGSSGSVSPGGDGGPTLQRSHFTVHQTGDVSQGAVRPSILHSSSVHYPAAAAAAATGGAAVAGYKAYQAVRSARAANRSEAAVRANGTAAQGARMTRGATTAARGFGDDGEGRCGEGRFGPGRRVGNRPSRRNLRTQRRDSSGSDDGAARGLPDARSQFGHRQGCDDGFACKRSECAPRNLRGSWTSRGRFEGCEKRRPRLDGPRRAGRGRCIVLGARRQFGPQRQCGARSRGLPWKRLGRFGSYGRFGSRSRGGTRRDGPSRGGTRNGSVGEERGGSTRGNRWSAWGRQRPWEPGRSARFDGRTGCKLRAPGCVRTEKRNVQARRFATARGVGWKGRHRLAVCPRRCASVRDDKGGRRIGCRKKAERRGGGSAAPRRAQPGLRLRARQGSHLPGGRNLAVRRGSGLAAGQGGAAEDRRGGGLAARSDRVAAEQGDSARRRGKFLGPRDLRQTSRSAYS